MKLNKKIKIKSSTDHLSQVRDFTKSMASESGFSDDAVGKIVLAVDEACTNIIKHAYGYSPEGEIMISVNFEKNKLTITLRDSGSHFNSSKVPEPDIKEYAKQRKVGGLGMFLMKKLMDEVVYQNLEDDSNQVVMVKYLN